MKDDLIEFLRKKDYKFIENIGQGGTGKTVLLLDETINEQFVCKKYAPYFTENQQLYFKNFVDEIKLSHLMFHKNVVRIFNYYLYPERTTGYILMEYIAGNSISGYLINNPERLNDVFAQCISGFRHLEENDVLHRDIRPDNILVSSSGIVKIIDFGFGKKTQFDGDEINSVSLNWRYTIPDDFKQKIYDRRTEIYFVGKLFEEIIKENEIENFGYSHVMKLMIKKDFEERISSFFEVDRMIIAGYAQEIDFSDDERVVYIKFANELQTIFVKIENEADYVKDIDIIINRLEVAYQNSMLEVFVQNPSSIGRCLVRGNYIYNNLPNLMRVSVLRDFTHLLKVSGLDKNRVFISNLWQRLDSIKRYHESNNDDLPF